MGSLITCKSSDGDEVLETIMWGAPDPKGAPKQQYQISKTFCDHILQKQQIQFVLNHEGKSIDKTYFDV